MHHVSLVHSSVSRATVLIPYWLSDDPFELHKSDHSWWFINLLNSKCLIFAGPYIQSDSQNIGDTLLIKINTNTLQYSLDECFWGKLRTFALEPESISLYWHIMEASATCRVSNLGSLRCPKVAVIGDTHHMKKPISSIIKYLVSENFSHVCCSHNQYNPFFSGALSLKAIDFPFCIPPQYKASGNHNSLEEHALIYCGSLISPHHLHRTRIVNKLLTKNVNLIVRPRTSFADWVESLYEIKLILTCSLNGTFSFQQFFPMLFLGCVFTDPLSSYNWLGSVLSNGTNCIVYSSSDDVKFALQRITDSDKYLHFISEQAKNTVLPFLRCPNSFTDANALAELENRRQLTEGEISLHNKISAYIKNQSLTEYLYLLNIFETIQELHRRYWEINIVQFNDDSDSDANLLSAMLMILPRIRIKSFDKVSAYKFRLCTGKLFYVYVKLKCLR